MSAYRRDFGTAWFHVDFGPPSLFERVRFKMACVHTLFFGKHFNRRAAERDVSSAVLDELTHFDSSRWALRMAEVRTDRGIVGVFPVAVNGLIGGRLAGFALDSDGGALLAAQVTQVPLGHDVDERGELAGVGVVAVDAVANGNKVDTTAFENDLRVKTGLEVVSPHPAEVLDQKMFYLPSLDVSDQLLPRGPVEVPPGPSVICCCQDRDKNFSSFFENHVPMPIST